MAAVAVIPVKPQPEEMDRYLDQLEARLSRIEERQRSIASVETQAAAGSGDAGRLASGMDRGAIERLTAAVEQLTLVITQKIEQEDG